MFKALGAVQLSKLTATAATVITALIPPRKRCYTRLTRILYRCSTTAHTVTVMKAVGKTTLAADAASGATTVVLSADPGGSGVPGGAIATNDWICIELDDGSFFLAKITLSTLTCTVAALPAAASAGNRVWTFAAPGDHASSQTTQKINPTTGSAFLCTASALNDWGDPAAGICQSLNQDEPMMVHSDNGTAAGTFELVSAAHTMN